MSHTIDKSKLEKELTKLYKKSGFTTGFETVEGIGRAILDCLVPKEQSTRNTLEQDIVATWAKHGLTVTKETVKTSKGTTKWIIEATRNP